MENAQEVRIRMLGTASPEQAAAISGEKDLPKVAVLVCHGMGQQVPFQTLDGVAQLLVQNTGQQIHEVTLVNCGGKLLPERNSCWKKIKNAFLCICTKHIGHPLPKAE